MKCIDGGQICYLKYDETFSTDNRFYICKIIISTNYYGKFNFSLYNKLIFGPSSLRECELKIKELENKSNEIKYIILEYESK